MELFGGKILRRSKMLACNAEKCGGSHHSSQKWVISSCSQSFLPRPNRVNHSIWSLSGGLCGGLMEFGLVGRKKCPQGVEIMFWWSRRVVKSANIATECAQQEWVADIVWHSHSDITHDKLLKKIFAGFRQMLVVWQRYRCLLEVGDGISTDLSEYRGILLNGVACESVREDAIEWLHIIRVFDLYPREKTRVELWNAKGPTGADLRSNFSR